MERQTFVCPECGAIKTFEQTEGMSRAEYFNRLPAQTPCETDGCDGYAKPEGAVSYNG